MTETNNGARDDGHWMPHLMEVAQDGLLLVRQELELAKAETIEKLTPAAVSSGMIVGGGLLTVLGGTYLLEGIVRLLATRMPSWLASLLFGAGLVFGGLELMRRGSSDLQAIDLVPEKTINSLKEDKEWLIDQIKSRLI